MVDQDTTEQEAERASGTRGADDDADRTREQRRLDGVADESVGQWCDRSSEPLDDATRYREPDPVRESTHERTDRESAERTKNHEPLAEEIPESADERDGHNRGQQEARRQPGNRDQRGVVVNCKRRQGGQDDGQLEAEVDCTEPEHQEASDRKSSGWCDGGR